MSEKNLNYKSECLSGIIFLYIVTCLITSDFGSQAGSDLAGIWETAENAVDWAGSVCSLYERAAPKSMTGGGNDKNIHTAFPYFKILLFSTYSNWNNTMTENNIMNPKWAFFQIIKKKKETACEYWLILSKEHRKTLWANRSSGH